MSSISAPIDAGSTMSAYEAVSEMKCSAETRNRSSRIRPWTILSVSGACVTGFEFQHIIDLMGGSSGISPTSARPICRLLMTRVPSGMRSGRQITSNL